MNRILHILLLMFPFSLCGQTIHISTPADTICTGTLAHFTATTTGTATPHYHWLKNSVAVGTDSSAFTTAALLNGDTISCQLTNAVGDTVFAVSNDKIIIVDTFPRVTAIFGVDSIVCVGSTLLLTDTTNGGHWLASNGYASVSGGVVLGISFDLIFEYHIWPGVDSIYYIKNNTCGSDTSFKLIFVTATPIAVFDMPDDMICVGRGISLVNGNGDFQNFYSVTGNATVSVAMVYGAHPGPDTLINIVSNQCGTASYAMPITVVGRPTISPITPPFPTICGGTSIQLTDSGANGTVIFYTSNNNASVNTSTGLVKGLLPGADTITLLLNNMCGSVQTTTVVTINPPDAIIGPDSSCAGSTFTLTDNWHGGVWGTQDSTRATVDNGIVHFFTDDTAVITYVFGGCTALKKIIPCAGPGPINGLHPLCTGAAEGLSNDKPIGTWYTSDANVAWIDSGGIVKGLSAGTATITFGPSKSCFVSQAVTISDPPPAITGDKTLCLNRHGNLYNDLKGGKWSSDDASIATVDSISGSIFGVSEGRVTITYTSPSDCSTTTYFDVAFCYREADIYPNPSSGVVTIEADASLYDGVTVTDMAGKTVLARPIQSTFTTISVHELPVGIYLITLSGENKKYVQKLLKE